MKKMLLVEDESDDAFLVKRAFERANIPCAVQIVTDGDKAVEYLSDTDRIHHPLPDLILLDIKLPRRNGIEVLHWIRSQPHLDCLPVVMLTNSDEPQFIGRAYREGANSYLVKPIKFQELEQMLPVLVNYWLKVNTVE
ncbi:MAG: response regulator [Pedosphaera sp.]|nr:response regulator [Pedosphaera sp.]